jgi:alkylation response protein AidB-like acyl-CoA dehydrogenase
VNFALSDEQIFLQEAARDALSRFDTIAAARAALEGEALPDLWPTACTAGWTGLLIAEERGGAGLGPLDAMLVLAECGRRLANASLLGHLPATYVLDRAGADAELLGRLASGEARAAFLAAQPPGDLDPEWTVEAPTGHRRAAAPKVAADGALTGTVAWIPDAPGADVLVVAAVDEAGEPRAVLVTDGYEVEPHTAYDATHPLGHVALDGMTGTVLPGDSLANAWHLAQTLIAAESLGAVEECLERSVAYAKERFTFGRAIGSYQAVKHGLTEVLRLQENARSLLYYAGWAGQDLPAEFPVAAAAARVAAGHALDFASRDQISVHGGIGATWEHDAPLFFRRAQLSRRLLGGSGGAADRVAGELLAAAKAA